ncbi:MAG: hypothetical protein FJ044_05105 [Candidatus Cloacimonetes bacterium]|nr:hypothetical protein [Candidatus Cloacimonadota bacterium]
MYNWSIDEEKFKKEDPNRHKIWMKHKEEIDRTVDFLSKNQWVLGGEVYVREPKRGFITESPVIITNKLRENMPKHEYVALSFNLDEVAESISVIEPNKVRKKEISSSCLVAKF